MFDTRERISIGLSVHSAYHYWSNSCPHCRTCPQVQPWLYGYDADAEVENALQKTPYYLETNTSSEGSLRVSDSRNKKVFTAGVDQEVHMTKVLLMT